MTKRQAYARFVELLSEAQYRIGVVRGIDEADELGFCGNYCDDLVARISALRREAFRKALNTIDRTDNTSDR